MNSEKLKLFATIAEIIGGVAIVVTLIILVLELQRNTVAVQRATYNEISQSINDWRSNLSFVPEVREVIAKLDSGDTLTPEQASIKLGVGRNLYSIYERAFWANEYDQVGEPEWVRFERMICISKELYWDEEGAIVFTEEFVRYVQSCP